MAANKFERTKLFILKNPHATNKEVMASAGVSNSTVSHARAELRTQGVAPKAFGDHKSKPSIDTLLSEASHEGAFDVKTTEDLNAEVEREASKTVYDPLDDEEIDFKKLKRILNRIAYRSTDDRVRTGAILALTKIQQDISDRPLGPGPPLTKDGAISRLIDLFKAVGPAIVIEALQTWTGKSNGTENIQDTSSSGVAEAASTS